MDLETRQNKQVILPHQNTRQTIEKKAISVLAEKGYDASSMREIAEASGVTKPVIYYYFQSKENLCQHIIRSGLEDFRQQIKEICEAPTNDVLSLLVWAVKAHFDYCKERTDCARFVYAINFGPEKQKIDYDFHSYGEELFR
ncbi:MAG: TetR/AcrR family transcriptional regulator, partial [Candidatus Lindowbacteria bacterium]|nr:TetR/AcrR family transcriptional regulator [Candidatus Lindowbacteria bacterium]